MTDRLDEYRRKRDARKTPEPVPQGTPAPGAGDTFVIQQHHARSLHWDLRLERDGVLVSWAVPRGIPRDPGRDHLAVNTEDHPMEYLEFSGDIPAGEYGAGRMTIYDRGTYTTEKWTGREVMVVLHGDRVSGRYVLFRTRGKDWMIHRMDPPEPGWTPMPDVLRPMLPATAARLPGGDQAWAYELEWRGQRAMAYVSGGRLRLTDAEGADITASYPELREMAESLAPTECVLDGHIVAFDAQGRVSPQALAPRVGADGASARRQLARIPVQYLAYDLLWLDGSSTVDVPYAQRRELLAGLELSGPHWQTPPHFPDGGGGHARQASQSSGLAGVVAKRLDSAYRPGEQTRGWRVVPNPKR